MTTDVRSSIDDQELVVKRRRKLVATATELFGRNSYDSTTMKEISRQAGFSTGLIYSYVQTKEDMLLLVLQGILNAYLTEIPKSLENIADPIERFCMSVRSYCKVVDANSDATILAYRATKDLSPARQAEIKKMEIETNNLVADCIQTCVELGYFRQLNVQLMAYQVVVVAHSWALKRWFLGKTVTLEGYIDETLDLFLHGAMTDLGWQHWQERTLA